MKRREFTLLAAPSVVLMTVLMIAPLVTTVVLSLNQFSYGTSLKWVGLKNYAQLLASPELHSSLLFTVLFVIGTTTLKLFLGFALALLLNFAVRARSVFLGALLVPLVVPPVVGALIYGWMFREDIGVGFYQYLLTLMGINIEWFSSTPGAIALLVGQNVWQDISFAALIFLAGLQVVPAEPLEAALVDGANWLQRQRYIIMPSLSGLFAFVSMMSVMDSFRIFDSIAVTTGGGPNGTTESLMFLAYKVSFQQSQLGLGSAMSMLTVIGIVLLLVPFLVLTKRQFRNAR
ncbi:sugar ABC transporter permease [Arthrobacter crusticola]|uniref:Sugar ABC transporter permease n=1 Tax=Arthrobacter crusticola TaxID=2547960 RepID=A0A4R5TNK2_9MICC|nr:sugar ABC transporter permease [Arthrobacter crusticola]TDK23963.1 sugar ABC transporter permease [Arthrobacter crusticola]